ncbi:MAG TPA: nuclear transport factor 2 family protein [Draconibacterium sp.]|nr:nuclear transport factor 2 family protein [Draconibacterium sp.]
MMFRYLNHLNLRYAIIAVSIISIASPVKLSAQSEKDSVAVKDFINMYQRTYNTHDPVAFAKFYTEDADFLMFTLPEIHGRQAIENFWRRYWQSNFNRQEPERRGTFTLNSLRFLANNVAVANVETITGGKDSLGVELQSRKARGTWLMQRQNSDWLISAISGMPTERDSIILGASIETAKFLQPHIRTFVDDYERAFNNHDPLAVTNFFRDNADIIVRNGPLIHGKQAIQNWWGNYFSKPRNYRALFIIDKIRTISDNIRQVNFTVTRAIPGAEDKSVPLRQTRAMWILVRETDEWRIDALRVLPSTEDRVIRH